MLIVLQTHTLKTYEKDIQFIFDNNYITYFFL